MTMKVHIPNASELHLPGKLVAPQKKAIMLAPTMVLLVIIPLYLFIDSSIPLQPANKPGLFNGRLRGSFGLAGRQYCDVFQGQWVPYPNATYYTNETCPHIDDQQNCLKFGRPDTEFLKWRWKPDGCELPRFDANEFLKIARGKSLAFVGDSVGRNQMLSLLCLLASVSEAEDITLRYASDAINFRRWFFPEYNFTLASFWAPFLVKAVDSDVGGHTYTSVMSLYLDEPEETWAREIENFEYVIVSAGQWFYRPMVFYEKGRLIGCSGCGRPNITEISRFYGYAMAFRTTFRTLLDLEGYDGVTFLRTFSPGHFENGPWNDGGDCVRTRPFGKDEAMLMGYDLDFYKTQVEQYRAAERESKKSSKLKRRRKFKLLDTSGASVMRPDGHPNKYGQSPHKKAPFNDCVHWCLPGPIDTWNEFLFHLMKPDVTKRFSIWKLQRSD